jgi:hypothetical protein
MVSTLSQTFTCSLQNTDFESVITTFCHLIDSEPDHNTATPRTQLHSLAPVFHETIQQKTVEEELPVIERTEIEDKVAVTTDTWYGKMSSFEIDVEDSGNEINMLAVIQKFIQEQGRHLGLDYEDTFAQTLVTHLHSKGRKIPRFKLFW